MKLDKKQIDRIRNKVDRDSKSFVEAT